MRYGLLVLALVIVLSTASACTSDGRAIHPIDFETEGGVAGESITIPTLPPTDTVETINASESVASSAAYSATISSQNSISSTSTITDVDPESLESFVEQLDYDELPTSLWRGRTTTLRISNTTSSTIRLAVGYTNYEEPDWVARGWLTIPPFQEGIIWSIDDYYSLYYYAEDDSGNVWQGDTEFWLDQDDDFAISDSFEQADANSRGYVRRGFRGTDVKALPLGEVPPWVPDHCPDNGFGYLDLMRSHGYCHVGAVRTMTLSIIPETMGTTETITSSVAYTPTEILSDASPSPLTFFDLDQASLEDFLAELDSYSIPLSLYLVEETTLVISNITDSTVKLAIGYYDTNIDEWVSRGWLVIPPFQQLTLESIDEYYRLYYYAEDLNGNVWQEGKEYEFWIDPDDDFTILYSLAPSDADVRGYVGRGFQEIDLATLPLEVTQHHELSGGTSFPVFSRTPDGSGDSPNYRYRHLEGTLEVCPGACIN